MAYTPELSTQESGMLRRIAWAIGRPMTKTMNIIFERLPEIYDRQMVCNACRDKSKCPSCGFRNEEEKAKASETKKSVPQEPEIDENYCEEEEWSDFQSIAGDYDADDIGYSL